MLHLLNIFLSLFTKTITKFYQKFHSRSCVCSSSHFNAEADTKWFQFPIYTQVDSNDSPCTIFSLIWIQLHWPSFQKKKFFVFYCTSHGVFPMFQRWRANIDNPWPNFFMTKHSIVNNSSLLHLCIVVNNFAYSFPLNHAYFTGYLRIQRAVAIITTPTY